MRVRRSVAIAAVPAVLPAAVSAGALRQHHDFFAVRTEHPRLAALAALPLSLALPLPLLPLPLPLLPLALLPLPLLPLLPVLPFLPLPFLPLPLPLLPAPALAAARLLLEAS